MLFVIRVTYCSQFDLYRVSQEEGTELRESVPYVKVYRYNPKHLYPKLNGYGDNGQRKVWSSGGSTHCTLSADSLPHVCPRLPCQITEIPLTLLRQYSTNIISYHIIHRVSCVSAVQRFILSPDVVGLYQNAHSALTSVLHYG